MASAIRAPVEGGRLRVDQPTTLPDGTVLDPVVDDEGDDLDEHDRAALHRAIARAAASIRRGEGRPLSDLLSELG